MLEIKNISKTFAPGTVNEKVVFDNFSLTVNDGDFITIIGSNGAGKSTLFNAIAGSFLVDSGDIILDGRNITYLPAHKRSRVIGRLYQDPRLGTAPDMSIEENLLLACGKGGWLSIAKKSEKDMIRERLASLGLGLENRMDTPVGLLSGGQRQVITLLMATIIPPKLLLLDEHTAALDPATADKVIEITKQIVTENKLTCLMVTHNMYQALELGNRTLMMDDGDLIFDVSGEERSKLEVSDLLTKFAELSGKKLDNDRVLLSK